MTVTYSDPELKQDAYHHWVATFDLATCGETSVDDIFVPGSVNLGNSGLDLALVGNLNELPPKVPMLGTLGIGVLLALLLCAGLVATTWETSGG